MMTKVLTLIPPSLLSMFMQPNNNDVLFFLLMALLILVFWTQPFVYQTLSFASQLSREEKSAWLKLSPDVQRLILLGHSNQPPSQDNGMPGPPRPVVRPPTGISSVDRRVLFTDAQKTIPSDDLVVAPQPVDLPTSNSGNPPPGHPTSVPSHFPGDYRYGTIVASAHVL